MSLMLHPIMRHVPDADYVSILTVCQTLATDQRHRLDSIGMPSLQGSAECPMLYLAQPGTASVGHERCCLHWTCLQSSDMSALQGAAGLPLIQLAQPLRGSWLEVECTSHIRGAVSGCHAMSALQGSAGRSGL